MKNILHITFSHVHARFPTLLNRCRGLGDETGSALVELALVSSLLFAPLLLGTVELAQVLSDSIEVSNAARAGASWAMMNSTSSSLSSGITTAAQAEASDFGTNLVVTPTEYWACSEALTGTQFATLASATSGCTGTSNHPIELIQVVTSATVSVPVKLPGLPATFPLSTTAITEAE